MLKNIHRQLSPLILQICRFSTNTAIEHTKKINPKILFCKLVKNNVIYFLNRVKYCNSVGRNKLNQCSLITKCSFAGASVPMIVNIDYEQMKKFINQNEVLVIDVRTKEELAETGVLPNSYNIPCMFDAISTQVHKLYSVIMTLFLF